MHSIAADIDIYPISTINMGPAFILCMEFIKLFNNLVNNLVLFVYFVSNLEHLK